MSKKYGSFFWMRFYMVGSIWTDVNSVEGPTQMIFGLIDRCYVLTGKIHGIWKLLVKAKCPAH